MRSPLTRAVSRETRCPRNSSCRWGWGGVGGGGSMGLPGRLQATPRPERLHFRRLRQPTTMANQQPLGHSREPSLPPPQQTTRPRGLSLASQNETFLNAVTVLTHTQKSFTLCKASVKEKQTHRDVIAAYLNTGNLFSNTVCREAIKLLVTCKSQQWPNE